MDNQPTIDRDLVLPILIGGFSVIGIIVVLLIGRALNTPAEVVGTPSATPFQYLYLGTEPSITTLLPEGSDIVTSPEETSIDGSPSDLGPGLGTPTRPSINPLPASPSSAGTPLILPPSNRTNTANGNVTNSPTSTASRLPSPTTSGTAIPANTYDDTDPGLDYSEEWTTQTDIIGPNAPYQGTLHISSSTGSTVTFNFTGLQINLYYLSSPSFGTVTVVLDDATQGTEVDQSQGTGVWTHSFESFANHKIEITHTGGGSVNLDKLYIPAPTPTPTRTPTLTPTP